MKFFLFLVLLAIVTLVQGQETVVFSTNPPRLSWYQLNTPNFKIVFPEGFEFQAQRMANTLEHIRTPEANSFGRRPKKISVILQNQTTVSNGFVTLAPRRSEFYAMPSQDNQFVGTNDFLNLLASHEYRHMVQFQNSITGFNRVAYYLFGQQFLAGLAFAAVPNWFWEGDAVATETAFTHSGRGRIPNFDLLFRTNLLENRNFSYQKQYLRSYKNSVPSYYVLGYQMVSYLRKKTGNPTIWGNITKRAWNVPFIPFAFSRAIHNEIGLYVNDLYKEMALDLKKQWQDELSQLPLTKFDVITKRSTDTYTDYKYPQPLEDGSIVVVKSGIGNIAELVKIKDGEEVRGYEQGQVNESGMISAVNSRVVWNEFRYDPRWQIKTYSVIKGFDFGSNSALTISKKSRYAAAALSPDGYSVATVETNTQYHNQLLVIDYFSRKIKHVFPNPSNDFISMPRWSSDGRSIIALRTNSLGKSIVKYDTLGSVKELTEPSDENIGYPVPYKNWVFYNSPYSGIDNIYALDVETLRRYQVTCSNYGAYHPAVSLDGAFLYYNDQSRDGLNVVKIPFEPSSWRPIERVAKYSQQDVRHLVEQEGRPGLLDSIPKNTFAVKKYSRLSGMVNPHSWGGYFKSTFNALDIGLVSQDILSTTSLNAGYHYDAVERVGSWKATASYQGFYPIVDVSVSSGKRSANAGDFSTTVVTGNSTVTRTYTGVKLNWDEQKAQVGLRIPFNTTTSKFFSNVSFGNSIGVTTVSNFNNSVNTARYFPALIRNDTLRSYYPLLSYQGNGTLLYNYFSFSAYRLLKTSTRDIYSRWGQYIQVQSFSTPFGGSYSGNLFSLYVGLYFPGFAKHHSLYGYWAYQNSQIDNAPLAKDGTISNYLFSNQVPGPRGQSIYRARDFYSMSVNYTFPLWYPDLSLGPVINFQRVRGNLFMDYAFGQTNSISTNYTSLGAELKVDFNLMRFLPQFNVGMRISQAVEIKTSTVEFLIGTIGF